MTVLPPDLTRVGHLMAPHGLRGAMKLFVIGDPEQLLKLRRLYLEGLGWRRVGAVQLQGPGVTVQLGGIDTREAALELRGVQVYAHDDELPTLGEGQFYYHELRGLRVQTEGGELLGEVTEVLDMGFQDVLVVRHSGGEALVPLQAPYVQVRRGVGVILEGAPEGLIGGVAEVVTPSAEPDEDG
ncbi:ribosome maturation factor RimM [Deinococcus sp.]|uniref:ribosome maturation factor RimM n=1 Tax=Deinococcus sp. TaxID=47478 RepID=UPI003C7BD3F4